MSANPVVSSVSASTSPVSLLQARHGRTGCCIYNDSIASLYIAFNSTVSTSHFTVKIAGGGYYEVPYGYTGAICGIWSAADGAARVTEMVVE